MTGLQIIKQQEVLGKDFKIYGTFEEPLMLAKDVAEWLEYTGRTGQMLATVDEDEKLKRVIVRAGQNREMWFLTITGTYTVLANSRKSLAKKLMILLDTEYPTHRLKTTAKQTKFELLLKESLSTYFGEGIVKEAKFLTEVPLLNYRLDMYFPEINLVVEYDEKFHRGRLKEDTVRQNNIINELGKDTTFIRVAEGDEVQGMVKILAEISKFK